MCMPAMEEVLVVGIATGAAACAGSSSCTALVGDAAQSFLESWNETSLAFEVMAIAMLVDSLTPGGLFNESSDSEDNTEDKHRNQDTPTIGEPNSTLEGRRRTREYGADGRPVRDYDKPHQGQEEDHVHEWEGGNREHPGRPYSPLN